MGSSRLTTRSAGLCCLTGLALSGSARHPRGTEPPWVRCQKATRLDPTTLRPVLCSTLLGGGTTNETTLGPAPYQLRRVGMIEPSALRVEVVARKKDSPVALRHLNMNEIATIAENA